MCVFLRRARSYEWIVCHLQLACKDGMLFLIIILDCLHWDTRCWPNCSGHERRTESTGVSRTAEKGCFTSMNRGFPGDRRLESHKKKRVVNSYGTLNVLQFVSSRWLTISEVYISKLKFYLLQSEMVEILIPKTAFIVSEFVRPWWIPSPWTLTQNQPPLRFPGKSDPWADWWYIYRPTWNP